MAAYFSEINHDNQMASRFVEVVVPTGTDMSGWSVVLYNGDGNSAQTWTFGAPASTVFDEDVYLLNSGNNAGFDGFENEQAIALVDDTGTVVQFVSTGRTLTVSDGPAAGQTSTDIGSTSNGESLETADDGASYYTQPDENPGTIICFAPGTLIDTPEGPRAVERLRPGDRVKTLDAGMRKIVWCSSRSQPLDGLEIDRRPVLIKQGALGAGKPAQDLVVSPQHRILVGEKGQLDHAFDRAALVPAKALTVLPGIRFMRGKKNMVWHHFAFARHDIAIANGCFAESLLFGPMVLQGLLPLDRREVLRLFPDSGGGAPNGPSARPILTVGEAKEYLRASRRIFVQGRSRTGAAQSTVHTTSATVH